MRKNEFRYFYIVCFIIIVSLPCIFINRINGKISITENRRLAQFPQVFNEEGKLNDGLGSGIKTWLTDNIGFRDDFFKLHAFISFNVFNTSPSDKVHLGKDGWYFYTQDHNLEIAQGTYPLNDEILKKIAKNQEEIQKYYNNQGIEYLLVLNPSKASVYPENIRGGNYSVGESPVDVVIKYLKENTTVNVISTKDDLLKAKESKPVFFKTDTHWNQEGAYVAYNTIINRLKEMGAIKSKPVSVNTVSSMHVGDLSAMMGDANLFPPEQINETKIIDPKAMKVEQGELFNQIQQFKQKYNMQDSSYIYTNSFVEKKNALIYGDSSLAYWNMPELIAENFSDFTFVWSNNMYKEINDTVKPDIVIMDRGERFMTSLADDISLSLLYGPIKNPQANIVSTTTPIEIKRGEKYNVDINVKNTSDESWSEGRAIRLCILQDGIDRGFRVKLPDGVEVKPNGEYTFTLYDFEAPSGDSTYLEYQMAQEGIGYFGEKKHVDIIVK